MAYYDYLCETCGLFTETRPMAQSADPCDCPTCGAVSPRVFMRPPNMALMDGSKRHAISRNEASSHAPRLSSETGNRPPARSEGRSGGAFRGRSKVIQHANGAKMAPSARPWMISP